MTLGKSAGFLTAITKSLTLSAAVSAFAASLAMSPAALVATSDPAAAQVGFSVSFGGFYNELAP